jgi:hypothetical protein
MKLKPLLLFFVFVIVFSCKDKEGDMNPAQSELGKYQLRLNGDDFDMINTIELKVGGNVIASGIVQKPGESVDQGYNYYYTGTYTMKDDVISIFQESYFQVAKAGQLFDSKDMLVLVQTRSASSDYKIQSNFSELQFICPTNAICLEEHIFRRIE